MLHGPRIRCVDDARVDARTDEALRGLLGRCFPDPASTVFIERRFFLEPPAWRWLAESREGEILAHAALRMRPGREADGTSLVLGGVSEVCTHPGHRGRGFARELLRAIHSFLEERQPVDLVLLFGNARVYRSSGYRAVPGPLRYWDPGTLRWVEGRVPEALWRPARRRDWPPGTVDLRGILF